MYLLRLTYLTRVGASRISCMPAVLQNHDFIKLHKTKFWNISAGNCFSSHCNGGQNLGTELFSQRRGFKQGFNTTETLMSSRCIDINVGALTSCSPFKIQARWSSDDSGVVNIKELSYEEMLGRVRGKGYTILDVRTPEEVAEGFIPGAKPLPVDEIDAALSLSPAAFEKKYGFKKPLRNEKIVTYCRKGVRAMTAAVTLNRHEYENVESYRGSWSEWSEQHPEDIRTPKN